MCKKAFVPLFALMLLLVFFTGCGVKAESDSKTESSSAAEGSSAVKNSGSQTVSGEKNAVPLSDEEIAQVNDFFTNGSASVNDLTQEQRIAACFLTSYYDSVENIDFQRFLKYFPFSEEVKKTEENREELDALGASEAFQKGWSSQTVDTIPVPVLRIREEDVEGVLNKHAGISTEKIAHREDVCYLEEYRAFYTFTSDFDPGTFHCVSGEVEGDIVRLKSDGGSIYLSGASVLTLERKDGEWLFRSLEPIE